MEIWQFDLRKGNSSNPREGACLLDAVSWFEYGELGDHPACVCETLAGPGRVINDFLPDDRRQELKILIPRMIGTAGDGFAQARAEFWAWQAIRVFAPLALEAAGLHFEAQKLRSCSDSLDFAARAARAAAQAAAWAAWAAWAQAAEEAEEAAQAAWAARAAVQAAQAARAAAQAAAWAAWAAWARAAEAAARAAVQASVTPIYDAAIAAMIAACDIGKPREIALERIIQANRSFELARA